MNNIGQELRKRRERKGYSLRQFAKKLKISNTYLSLIERSMITIPPSDEVINQLEKELDFPKYFLFVKYKRIPKNIERIALKDIHILYFIEQFKGLHANKIKEKEIEG